MKKKLLALFLIFTGITGMIVISLLESHNALNKKWSNFFKGGHTYLEKFIVPHKKIENAKSNHTSKPIVKLIINGEIKHLYQSDFEANLDAFIQEHGRDKIYVNHPSGEVFTICIWEVPYLRDGYTLFDDSKNYKPKK